MSDETEDELRREAKAARDLWWTAKMKAHDLSREALREAESSMGVAALHKAVEDADARLDQLAARGRAELTDGWKWDEWGRACCEFPNETVCMDADGDVEFMDHDKNTSMSRPASVVRAVLAAEVVEP